MGESQARKEGSVFAGVVPLGRPLVVFPRCFPPLAEDHPTPEDQTRTQVLLACGQVMCRWCKPLAAIRVSHHAAA